MKTRINLGTIFALAVVTLLLVGCGGGEQPATETPATQTQAEPAADVYPIDYCIVSGHKLGSMGEPVTYDHEGRTIKFCCAGCVSEFQKSPEMFIARLDSAATGLLEQIEGEMPTEEEPAGEHEGHDHGR